MDLISWTLRGGQMEGTVNEVPLFWIFPVDTPAELEQGIRFGLMTFLWGNEKPPGFAEWSEACAAAEIMLLSRMAKIGFVPVEMADPKYLPEGERS
jgi:hypothetical protein